jgi:predicted HD phosphohydrolase
VVCALLHDIGDILGSYSHAELAAAIVHPFVSEENHWIVEHRAIFQGYYFFHYLDLDRNMRDEFRGYPHFEKTEEFCRLFDQTAFDTTFQSMPPEAFEPLLYRVFRQPQRSIYVADLAAWRNKSAHSRYWSCPEDALATGLLDYSAVYVIVIYPLLPADTNPS